MLNFFKYMWYRFYRNSLRFSTSPPLAGLQAVFGVSFFWMLNVDTILIWTNVFTGAQIFDDTVTISLVPPLIMFSSFAAVCGYWIPGGRYKAIIDKYESLDRDGVKNQKVAPSVLFFWIYQFTSLFFFVAGILFQEP